MTNIWVVRSEFGKYSGHFLEGGLCGCRLAAGT